MQQRHLDLLACPIHGNSLALVEPTDGPSNQDAQSIVMEGLLVCPRCDQPYRIEGGVANLLPPSLGQEPADQ